MPDLWFVCASSGHYAGDINVLTLAEQTRLKQFASMGSAALSADEVVQKCQQTTQPQEG